MIELLCKLKCYKFNKKFLYLSCCILLSAILLLSVAACSSSPQEEGTWPDDDHSGGEEEGAEGGGGEAGEENFSDNDSTEKEEIDIVLPEEIIGLPSNELGDVMILMYHEIGYPESEWCRTPENFRKDLEALYYEGYRLVSMNQLIDGDINISKGTTPVVLTFDDGTAGQFRYIEQDDGELVIDPDSAVGIMEDFYAEYPDFGLAATFYVFYENPFRQKEYITDKFSYLVERGFEIGNHAYTHGNLSQLSSAKVQEQLGMHVKRTRDYLPGYEIRSLALPYGARPSPAELAITGTHEGTSYHHEAVLLVGANPAPSPFSDRFSTFLPRIRASEMNTEGVGMYEWMERFRQNPENRFLKE